MTLEELRSRRKELTEKARNLRAIAEQENRELSEDESRELEDQLARAEHLTVEIEREERLQRLEEDTERPHQKPQRPDVGNEQEQRDNYGKPTRFRSFGEQMQAVMRAGAPGGSVDHRLIEMQKRATGLSEGIPADGGFLVQTDFATELLKRTYETGVVANRCRRIGLSSNANSIKIPAIAESSRADGSRWGGIKAYWKGEAAQKTNMEPKFRQISLELKKLTGLCYATDELLQDAAALEAVLMQGFSEEFGFRLDDAIINGAGAGAPQGIINAACLVTVAAEGAQPVDTIVFENLVKMWSRCYAKSRLNAVWFINQDVEPQLFSVGVQVGVGGVPAYLPPGGLSQSPYGTLFGRPVIAIEQCPTLGDVGDIILADFSQYILVDKGGMQTASSIHVKFDYDETCFRFVYRVDGQPIWHDELTPFKGAGNTVSPFVVLAAR